MPAVLKIDRRRRLVRSTFYGELSGAELLAHAQSIRSDPEFDPSFDELVDFSEVKLALVSEATLAALAGSKSLYSDSSLHVIVAPEDMPHELATRYQVMARATRPNLYVVRNVEEAYELLRRRTPANDSKS